tara:strand:- start:40966 stop:41352 length:387 start_codon:yes stop_codon:yes gene_type:complete
MTKAPHEHVIQKLGGRTGRVELIALCRTRAIENGSTLETMIWDVMHGLQREAKAGNVPAAKLFFSQLVKMEKEQSTDPATARLIEDLRDEIEEAKSARTRALGPPVPEAVTDYVALGNQMLDELDLLQ